MTSRPARSGYTDGRGADVRHLNFPECGYASYGLGRRDSHRSCRSTTAAPPTPSTTRMTWRCPLSFAYSGETADAVVTAESDSSGNGERNA